MENEADTANAGILNQLLCAMQGSDVREGTANEVPSGIVEFLPSFSGCPEEHVKSMVTMAQAFLLGEEKLDDAVKMSVLDVVKQLMKYGTPAGSHFHPQTFNHQLFWESSTFKKICMVMTSGAHSVWMESAKKKNLLKCLGFNTKEKYEMLRYVSNLVDKVLDIDGFYMYYPKILWINKHITPDELLLPNQKYPPLDSGLAGFISNLAAPHTFSNDATRWNLGTAGRFDSERALSLDFQDLERNIMIIIEDTKELLEEDIGKPLLKVSSEELEEAMQRITWYEDSLGDSTTLEDLGAPVPDCQEEVENISHDDSHKCDGPFETLVDDNKDITQGGNIPEFLNSNVVDQNDNEQKEEPHTSEAVIDGLCGGYQDSLCTVRKPDAPPNVFDAHHEEERLTALKVGASEIMGPNNILEPRKGRNTPFNAPVPPPNAPSFLLSTSSYSSHLSFNVLQQLKFETFRALTGICGLQDTKIWAGKSLSRGESMINNLALSCKYKLKYEGWFVLDDVLKMEQSNTISSKLDRFMEATIATLTVDAAGNMKGTHWHRCSAGRFISSFMHSSKPLQLNIEDGLNSKQHVEAVLAFLLDFLNLQSTDVPLFMPNLGIQVRAALNNAPCGLPHTDFMCPRPGRGFQRDRQHIEMFDEGRDAPSLVLRFCGQQPFGLRVWPGSHIAINRKGLAQRLKAIEGCSARLVGVPPYSVMIMRSDLVHAELGSLEFQKLFDGYPLADERILKHKEQLFRVLNGHKMNFNCHCVALRSGGTQYTISFPTGQDYPFITGGDNINS